MIRDDLYVLLEYIDTKNFRQMRLLYESLENSITTVRYSTISELKLLGINPANEMPPMNHNSGSLEWLPNTRTAINEGHTVIMKQDIHIFIAQLSKDL